MFSFATIIIFFSHVLFCISVTASHTGSTWSQGVTISVPYGSPETLLPLVVDGRGMMRLLSGFNDRSYSPEVQISYSELVSGATSWSQQAVLTPLDTDSNHKFGFSADFFDDYAIVGAPGRDLGDSTTGGSAYIFQGYWTKWSEQQKLVADVENSEAKFGYSVLISEKSILVSSFYDDDRGDDSGSVYSFIPESFIPESSSRRNLGVLSSTSSNRWSQHQKLIPKIGSSGDFFGVNMVMEEGIAVIGASYSNLGTGSAYIFFLDETTLLWSQQQQLLLRDSSSGSQVGKNLAIYGKTIVVADTLDSSTGVSNLGAAYVFRATSGNAATHYKYSLQQKIICPIANPVTPFGAFFGDSIALYGDTMMIGAFGLDALFGNVFVFTNSGGKTWTSTQRLTDPIQDTNQQFTHPYMYGMSTFITDSTPRAFYYTADYDWNCLTVSLGDQFGDGWDNTAKLIITAPDSSTNSYAPSCDTRNPLQFRYCPTLPSDYGTYTFSIPDAKDSKFFWEIYWTVTVEKTGKLYRGDYSTKMSFSFDQNSLSFDFHSAEHLQHNKTCTVCAPKPKPKPKPVPEITVPVPPVLPVPVVVAPVVPPVAPKAGPVVPEKDGPLPPEKTGPLAPEKTGPTASSAVTVITPAAHSATSPITTTATTTTGHGSVTDNYVRVAAPKMFRSRKLLTDAPTGQPSSVPSSLPSGAPSGAPSGVPTSFPSSRPTHIPTAYPTLWPTLNSSYYRDWHWLKLSDSAADGWYEEDQSGTAYYISDTDGSKLVSTGSLCPGTFSYDCWQDLKEGTYLLRVSGGLDDDAGDHIWEFCGKMGGGQRELIFKIAENTCTVIASYSRNEICSTTTTPMVVLKGALLVVGLDYDIELTAGDTTIFYKLLASIGTILPSSTISINQVSYSSELSGHIIQFTTNIIGASFGYNIRDYEDLTTVEETVMSELTTAISDGQMINNLHDVSSVQTSDSNSLEYVTSISLLSLYADSIQFVPVQNTQSSSQNNQGTSDRSSSSNENSLSEDSLLVSRSAASAIYASVGIAVALSMIFAFIFIVWNHTQSKQNKFMTYFTNATTTTTENKEETPLRNDTREDIDGDGDLTDTSTSRMLLFPNEIRDNNNNEDHEFEEPEARVVKHRSPSFSSSSPSSPSSTHSTSSQKYNSSFHATAVVSPETFIDGMKQLVRDEDISLREMTTHTTATATATDQLMV